MKIRLKMPFCLQCYLKRTLCTHTDTDKTSDSVIVNAINFTTLNRKQLLNKHQRLHSTQIGFLFTSDAVKPSGVQSEIPLPSDDFLFDLLKPWDVRALSIRKTADIPLQLRVGTFPRFVAIRFYFLSETLIYIGHTKKCPGIGNSAWVYNCFK